MTIANVTGGATITSTWGNSVADAINAGELTAWTPTYTNCALGTVVANYRQVGDVVDAFFSGAFTASPTGQFRVSLPIAPATGYVGVGVSRLEQSGAPFTRYIGAAEINKAVFGDNVVFSSTGNNGWNATVPATILTGWALWWHIAYRV